MEAWTNIEKGNRRDKYLIPDKSYPKRRLLIRFETIFHHF